MDEKPLMKGVIATAMGIKTKTPMLKRRGDLPPPVRREVGVLGIFGQKTVGGASDW